MKTEANIAILFFICAALFLSFPARSVFLTDGIHPVPACRDQGGIRVLGRGDSEELAERSLAWGHDGMMKAQNYASAIL
jgi:hypothetical protein